MQLHDDVLRLLDGTSANGTRNARTAESVRTQNEGVSNGVTTART